MFSNDVSMARGRSDTKFLREQVSESGRIQICSWSDDTVFRQPADLPRYVRQDIHWVARYDQNRVRAVLDKLRNIFYVLVGIYLYILYVYIISVLKQPLQNSVCCGLKRAVYVITDTEFYYQPLALTI